MASKGSSFHDGVFSAVLLFPVRLFLLSALTAIGLILAAWTIDWVFVFAVWPSGIDRLKEILAEDLARALDLSARQHEVPAGITVTANALYAALFKLTGIHDMALRFAQEEPLSIPDSIARTAYLGNKEAIQVAMVGTQLFGVRAGGLGLGMPLLALLYVVAVADGLAQRAIRRECGGRESGNVYHRAKHMQIVLLLSAAAITLLIPASIDPRWILTPSIAAIALLARVQWAYYKKHL